MPDFLTTKELAELLRIKERKVYDLVSSGSVPCTRATGKLLFPRDAINLWLENHGNDSSTTLKVRPNVFLGSHDPLLEWSIRESNCGIATWFDGSRHGLEKFVQHEGIASGTHILNLADNSWNIDAIEQQCSGNAAVLIEWTRRERGLIVNKKCSKRVHSLADLRGLHLAARQEQAGAHDTLMKLLHHENIEADAINFSAPYRTENEAAVAVLAGDADAAFGLQALAQQYKLKFVPVIQERFDILVDRKSWFEPPMQTLIEFTESDAFKRKSDELAGYCTSNLGAVQLNL